ncbi:MAG: hypothetical protein AB7S26_04285 [Sandaracinaceae bacterium]
MARKIEMHWVCSSCQTRNLGRHKVCQQCGDPKDASEPWLMPSDTRAAPSVTDPALLQQANAGPDWRCGYCGSYQRRSDGSCAKCGAGQVAGATVQEATNPVAGVGTAPMGAPGAPRAALAAPGAPRPRTKVRLGRIAAALGAVIVPCIACCGFAYFNAPPPPPPSKPASIRADVVSVEWTRIAHVERRQLVDEEGFVETRPSDALEIRSLGQAHHHDEQVLDHYETEHYTEQVPYQDTETYTDQEQCGEDCTSLPESCHEECTSDNNGFASCHDVCTGGGQSCSPRYCSVTRTRSVTRYRTEPRTREVPRYRSEPRYAERFAWRAWRWRPARDVPVRGGLSSPPRWPNDAELTPPEPLGEGEQERSQREEQYRVSLVSTDGRRTLLQPPTEAEFTRITAHEHWYVAAADPTHLVKPAPTVSVP